MTAARILWEVDSQTALSELPQFNFSKLGSRFLCQDSVHGTTQPLAALYDPFGFDHLSTDNINPHEAQAPSSLKSLKDKGSEAPIQNSEKSEIIAQEIKHKLSLPLIVIICHESWLDDPIFQRADGLYIPGPHCRQGDLLAAAGKTRKPLWIERGSFLSPTDFKNVLMRTSGASQVTLVDAGSHFGYADRVLDPRALTLYESWKASCDFGVSLSFTDLVAGESSGSSYRPVWADSESLYDFVFRMSAAWKTGLVFKKHPRLGTKFLTSQLKNIEEALHIKLEDTFEDNLDSLKGKPR